MYLHIHCNVTTTIQDLETLLAWVFIPSILMLHPIWPKLSPCQFFCVGKWTGPWKLLNYPLFNKDTGEPALFFEELTFLPSPFYSTMRNVHLYTSIQAYIFIVSVDYMCLQWVDGWMKLSHVTTALPISMTYSCKVAYSMLWHHEFIQAQLGDVNRHICCDIGMLCTLYTCCRYIHVVPAGYSACK